MKKILLFILIILVNIFNSSAQGWYHNMEKYWWYRYRLVNDYLYIDPNDGPGSCIPAQHRTHPSPTYADLRWEDATIRLGHYIGALAVEYRMLKDNGWDTWRTEYELYHAIRAFDRLDQNAETMCRDINGNFPYSPGPWGTPWTTLLNNNTPGPLNGFFLRDDVPFNNTITSPPVDHWHACTPDASALSMPGNYGLYLGDGILTEHVRVASHSTSSWADFVFKKDYSLMPLNKVETYVKVNSHLPGVPSADEVAKDGIDVENMDVKLLQKIEELTLYAIQQQKRIDDLEKKLNILAESKSK